MSAPVQLRMMVNGFQLSQALHVAAVLGISDLLADGPMSSAELAARTGTDTDTLTRVLRALVTVGVYRTVDDGRIANTELGAALRSDAPESVAAWARFIGRPYYWQAWAGLLDSVRTGENAFSASHGESVWSYRVSHPDELAIFDQAMTEVARAVSRAVVDAYDFSRFTTVVDVGGGRGTLLAAILSACPTVHGVVFDLPGVAAAAPPLLAAAGVAERARSVGGDFFSSIPEGGDAYLAKSVLHDWPDAEAIAILRAIRAALPPDGVVLVIEQLLDEGPDPVRTALSDLNMLVSPGGRERTLEEYRELFGRAGLQLARSIPTSGVVFLLEATASRDEQ